MYYYKYRNSVVETKKPITQENYIEITYKEYLHIINVGVVDRTITKIEKKRKEVE